jgi:hypothetical protein
MYTEKYFCVRLLINNLRRERETEKKISQHYISIFFYIILHVKIVIHFSLGVKIAKADIYTLTYVCILEINFSHTSFSLT